MNVSELCLESAKAVLHGQQLTLTLPAGQRRPAGFPRGELLSVNQAGDRNVSFDPVKVLAWLQKSTRAAQAIYGDFIPAVVELTVRPTSRDAPSDHTGDRT